MVMTINQFAIQRQKGNLTTAPDWNVLTCKIDASQVGELTYGDAVIIKGSASGQTTVEKAAAATADIFGFVIYSIKKNTWVAGDYINVAFNDAVMFMEASAAIASGAPVQFDPSTKKIATQSAGNTTVGIAFQKASADGDLIPVLIKTPNVAPNISTSYTPGTVTASDLVCVDANKDIADFRTVQAVNFDAGASGTAGTIDVFPTTASKGKFSLACTDQTGNTAVTLNANAMGQATVVNMADPGAAASYVVQSTAAISLAEADLLDVSAQTETIAAAGAVSVVKRISKLALVGAGAVTIAAPNANMLGQVKLIEMTVDNGDVTMALTNVDGGTAATTATFGAVGDALTLVGGVTKWHVVGEAGVVLS